MNNPNSTHKNSKISPDATVINSYIEWAEIGAGTLIVNSTVIGTPEKPVVIGPNCKIISSHLSSDEKFEPFSFAGWSIDTPSAYIVGKNSRIEYSNISSSKIGESVEITSATVRSSSVERGAKIRPNANIYRSSVAADARIGSELSKTIIAGEGFTSEHQNSYLSLVAPARYPIITPEGREELTPPLPNLTNIGAGTVFANYSGKPLPAADLDSSSGSQKGTAVVYNAFTAVNSVIVNRYGQPEGGEDPFQLLRRRDLTILGFASFVEKKVTGRIPAFSYSGQTSAGQIQVGWVLEKHPGIVLNFIKKMRKVLGPKAHLMNQLIEGTIRLEIQLLREELKNVPKSFFKAEQLEAGLAVYQKNLDGRWKMDGDGQLVHKWTWDEKTSRWICQI